MPGNRFQVDTHLFRELGEYLVGRNSTALMELVKNSYDADATEVTIDGQNLSDLRSARVVITDNGTGMDEAAFRRGFLTIASRFKDQDKVLSSRKNRRFTGAKGIGRLAAHKLARRMMITSIPDPDVFGNEARGIIAIIDWDELERFETLDQVSEGAVVVDSRRVTKKDKIGTEIVLENLRRAWNDNDRVTFQLEVEGFRPPSALTECLPRMEGLFLQPLVSETSKEDSFEIRLIGELETGEEYWQNIISTASWVLEVDTISRPGEVAYAMLPTKKTEARYPNRVKPAFYTRQRLSAGPGFQARILTREGHKSGIDRSWLSKNSGIRVYREGFRVLPYGQGSDDWLRLDEDYRGRSRSLMLLNDAFDFGTDMLGDEGLTRLPNASYFGAVFLTQGNSEGLEILINREGFLPNEEFDTMVTELRVGLQLLTRLRRVYEVDSQSEEPEIESESQAPVRKPKQHPRQKAEVKLQQGKSALANAKASVALARTADELETARQNIQAVIEDVSDSMVHLDEAIGEIGFIRVLASLGGQMAGFVHEVLSILGVTQQLEKALRRVIESTEPSPKSRQQLEGLADSLRQLRQSIERQASYLTDVVAPDSRRRRSRQSLRERFQSALKILEPSAVRRGIKVENMVDGSFKSPPMFPAEMTMILTNLLSNAIKAAASVYGKVTATGLRRGPHTVFRLENTGASVDLVSSERWFRPFESTTAEIDPQLGQGMGMGLALTRTMLEEYGASIRFVPPSAGFSTAIEIEFEEKP